ncbi:MAG: hypothetical protein DWI28_00075 [Planctomycetota bacterium]|nr:MAG: hypothetical protein DWI28_00075 [Planctomycetota bacterium]
MLSLAAASELGFSPQILMKSTPCPSSIPNQVLQNNQPRRFFPVEKPMHSVLLFSQSVFSNPKSQSYSTKLL